MSEDKKDKDKKHKPEGKGGDHKGDHAKAGAHPKGEGKGGQKSESKRKPKQASQVVEAFDDTPQGPPPPARLYNFYRETVVPQLKEKFGYKNIMAVPRLEKIVISMGVGKLATAGEKAKV